MSDQPKSVFRIDKFDVPSASRDEFLAKLRETHALLDGVEGCMQNYVLEKSSGPGRFNVVTFVEWRDQTAYDVARSITRSRHQKDGVEPQSLFDRLGIGADIADYAVVRNI